jgi:hypothetical protein
LFSRWCFFWQDLKQHHVWIVSKNMFLLQGFENRQLVLIPVYELGNFTVTTRKWIFFHSEHTYLKRIKAGMEKWAHIEGKAFLAIFSHVIEATALNVRIGPKTNLAEAHEDKTPTTQLQSTKRTKIQTFSRKQDFDIQMHIKADLDV